MGELLGWIFVLGLALAIGCSFALSSHLERESDAVIQAILRDNQGIRVRPERRAPPATQASAQVPGPAAEVIVELRPTRRSQREDLLSA